MSKLRNDMYVDASLVCMDLHAINDEDALDQMATMLLKNGIVKESYLPAVKAREIEFSTGLLCEDMGVAIPHTDAEHVNRQAIGIGILKEPVLFRQMGTVDEMVPVKLIFMLAIKEPHQQMEFLQTLMMAFMDKGKLVHLYQADSATEVVKTFETFFE